MYYREVLAPVKVTDEEYEEIKKYAPKAAVEAIELDNKAENFLAALNTISLVIGMIVAVFILIQGISTSGHLEEGLAGAIIIAGASLVSWAIWKVVLNISNNLHKINGKLKK